MTPTLTLFLYNLLKEISKKEDRKRLYMNGYVATRNALAGIATRNYFTNSDSYWAKQCTLPSPADVHI